VVTGWDVEYRSLRGSRELKSWSTTREGALRDACDRMYRGDAVRRITGPRGEVIERPEIEQHYQKSLVDHLGPRPWR
jgi:hypothetical protein